MCETLRKFRTGSVQLIDRPMPSVMVDLDTATAIGLAVTELITNSYRHAFPSGNAGDDRSGIGLPRRSACA